MHLSAVQAVQRPGVAPDASPGVLDAEAIDLSISAAMQRLWQGNTR